MLLSLMTGRSEDFSSSCVEQSRLYHASPVHDTYHTTITQFTSCITEPALLRSPFMKDGQYARLDLLQFPADFFPYTLLHFLSLCCYNDAASLGNDTAAQVATVSLVSLRSCVNKSSTAILSGAGEEQLVDPEDPRQRACYFARQFTTID
jgi:hypothetical protein